MPEKGWFLSFVEGLKIGRGGGEQKAGPERYAADRLERIESILRIEAELQAIQAPEDVCREKRQASVNSFLREFSDVDGVDYGQGRIFYKRGVDTSQPNIMIWTLEQLDKSAVRLANDLGLEWQSPLFPKT
jgi:hypothetical protein